MIEPLPDWLRVHRDREEAIVLFHRLRAILHGRLDRPIVFRRSGLEFRATVLGLFTLKANHAAGTVQFRLPSMGRGVWSPDFLLFPLLATRDWTGLLQGMALREAGKRPRCPARAARSWVVRSLWSWLEKEPRFRALRRDRIFAALGLSAPLVMIALRSRAPRMGGLHTTDFALAWRHRGAFEQIDRECPRIISWYRAAMWASRLEHSGDPLHELRRVTVAIGDSRLWRRLLQYGLREARPLWRAQAGLPGTLFDLAESYYATVHEAHYAPPPPPSFLRAWIALTRHRPDGVRFPRGFIRLAVRRADALRNSRALASFVLEFTRTGLWAAVALNGKTLPRNSRWQALARRASQWHTAQQLAKQAELAPASGSYTAGRFGGFIAVPLATPLSIFQEGVHMRNCILRYLDRAVAPGAKVRLFSLRDAITGRRVASVGIRDSEDGKQWQVFDAKRFANGRPTDAILAAANSIANACSQLGVPTSFAPH